MRQLHAGRQRAVEGHTATDSGCPVYERQSLEHALPTRDENQIYDYDIIKQMSAIKMSILMVLAHYDSKDIIIGICGYRGPLSLLQLNCRNCQALMHEVEEVISAGGLDIVVLQEPYLQKDFEVNGHHSFIPRGATAKVCTLVAVGLQVFHLSRFDTEHSIALSVGSRQMSCGLIVLNAYFQYNSNHNIFINQIDNVVLYNRHRRILLCADSNANSPLWFSKKKDSSVKLLCQFL